VLVVKKRAQLHHVLLALKELSMMEFQSVDLVNRQSLSTMRYFAKTAEKELRSYDE
jgi:predicted nucleotidyltransferase